MTSGPSILRSKDAEVFYRDMHRAAVCGGHAFVDPGDGHTHTAFNRTGGVTVIYATFFEVPPQGPLTITAGVEAPAGCHVGS